MHNNYYVYCTYWGLFFVLFVHGLDIHHILSEPQRAQSLHNVLRGDDLLGLFLRDVTGLTGYQVDELYMREKCI